MRWQFSFKYFRLLYGEADKIVGFTLRMGFVVAFVSSTAGSWALADVALDAASFGVRASLTWHCVDISQATNRRDVLRTQSRYLSLLRAR